jgi:hypothetical protein
VTVFTPPAIGGQFTQMIAYFPPLIWTSGDGHGGTAVTGWAGSGSATATDGLFSDNGSTTWPVAPSTASGFRAQGRKYDPWEPQFRHDYALGALAPQAGEEYLFAQDSPAPSYPPYALSWMAYYDNTGVSAGTSGPEQSAANSSRSWLAVSEQPSAANPSAKNVETYPANQLQFSGGGVPVSQFSVIRSYADAASPLLPAGSHPVVDYEAAWDIYGYAHTGVTGISLECMFWTRNHNQNPGIGPLADSGINFGDGRLWDLYVTADTAATGGVVNQYSYGIFYLQDAFQEDSGWVDILAGLRYFLKYFVVPSGPSAPANALAVPIYQITRGWEVVNTNGVPLPFRLNDYRLVIS